MGTQGNEQFMRDLILFFVVLMSTLLVVHFGLLYHRDIGNLVHLLVQWVHQETGLWARTT